MLDMVSCPRYIERIVKLLPFTRSDVVLSSATMPPEITRLADQFLHNPVDRSRPPGDHGLHHRAAPDRHRRAGQARGVAPPIRPEPVQNAIVLQPQAATGYRRQEPEEARLRRRPDPRRSRPRRICTATLDLLRRRPLRSGVASDVAWRAARRAGEVSHVFTFDVPIHLTTTFHRIGCTDRAGRSGVSDYAGDAARHEMRPTLPRS